MRSPCAMRSVSAPEAARPSSVARTSARSSPASAPTSPSGAPTDSSSAAPRIRSPASSSPARIASTVSTSAARRSSAPARSSAPTRRRSRAPCVRKRVDSRRDLDTHSRHRGRQAGRRNRCLALSRRRACLERTDRWGRAHRRHVRGTVPRTRRVQTGLRRPAPVLPAGRGHDRPLRSRLRLPRPPAPVRVLVRDLPRQLTVDELAELFEGRTRFVEQLAEREYPLATARDVARTLSDDEKKEVLDAHPAIGQRGGLSVRSRQEQGDDADSAVLAELAELNRAYEDRFGFRFVVFVDRRPKS